jgi:hypothetical protein
MPATTGVKQPEPLSLCDGRAQHADDESKIFCHVLPRTEAYHVRSMTLRPQLVLTGSAAGCGSGVLAGWPAACQILAASRIIAIPQGAIQAMTIGPLADCAAA